MSVIAVGSYDGIIRTHCSDGTRHYSFLTDVKVAEAANFLRLILLARAFLKTADQQHQREHFDFVALLGALHRNLRDARQCGFSARPAGFSSKVHARHKKKREEQIAEDGVAEKHPGRG